MQDDILELGYNEETVSLYDTPYNDLFIYLTTPFPDAINRYQDNPRETRVTPITLNENALTPTMAYRRLHN